MIISESSLNKSYHNYDVSSGNISDETIAACSQLAATFVDNIIKLASEEAANRLNQNFSQTTKTTSKTDEATATTTSDRTNSLQNPTPSIQIDLIGPRSPTPDEELFPWVEEAKRSEEIRKDADEKEKNREDDISDKKSKSQSVDSKTAKGEPKIDDSHMEEIQQFAMEYVKDIISKATVLACERETTLHSLHSEISQNKIPIPPTITSNNNNLSWLERLRHVFRRLVVRACLCKTKHDSVHSFKES